MIVARGSQRAGCLLLFLSLALALVVLVDHDRADAAAEPGALTVEPVAANTAAGAQYLFGSSPNEAPGEVWGYGLHGGLVRYTTAGGWENFASPLNEEGVESTVITAPETSGLFGRTTPAGGVVVAMAPESSGQSAVFAVRDPGGQFQLTPEPEEAMLAPEESLYQASPGNLLFVAVEEGEKTGIFDVPPKVGELPQDKVLHFDGSSWTAESICGEPPGCPEPSPQTRILAIDATGPGNAWLLAEHATGGDGVELFRREAGGEWRKVFGRTSSSPFGKEKPATGVTVHGRPVAQPLTVTSNGVWVDIALTLKPPAIAGGTEGASGTLYYSPENGSVTSWCDLQGSAATLCNYPLGSELPSQGRSFAWPATPTEPFGRRVITGVGQGAIMTLTGTSFERIPLAGGNAGANYGAALAGPEEGWLGSEDGPLRITREPTLSSLSPWPLPFRWPLTAIAPQPGAPVGELSSQALAVGDQGEVARYLPGQGWVSEFLQNSAGVRQTPRLRAVAWPQPNFAYAVGDEGAMWMWRGSTGLWESDPGAPPNLIRGNFTSIAFDPSEPERGYAVGKQGLLLGYGRQWTQESLPAEINAEENFTSVAFAGEEALAAYSMPDEEDQYEGGLLANDGSGWHTLPPIGDDEVPYLVAGLSDGGTVVATRDGEVFERNGPGAPWERAPGLIEQGIVAIAPFREEGQIRALISVGEANEALADEAQATEQPAPGEPPLLTAPYPLAGSGVLERQIATGWRDEQHEGLPIPTGSNPTDLPEEPEPILSLLVSADGSGGWAVGGETGSNVPVSPKIAETASVMRYGVSASPPNNFSEAPIPAAEGAAFAIGGNDQCGSPCADQAGTRIGPDQWLPSAVSTAGKIPGVRGFIYTGPGVAEPTTGLPWSQVLSVPAFSEEERAYARRLTTGAGSLAVFPTVARSDLDRAGTFGAFSTAFTEKTPIPTSELARGYYSTDSSVPGSPYRVRIIFLDYASPTLGATQACWLAQELEASKAVAEPAIVVGNRDLNGRLIGEQEAADAIETTAILATGVGPTDCATPQPGAASAYFFNYPEENREFTLSSAGRSVPAFGSGTLGYVRSTEGSAPPPNASGFLVASVGAFDPTTAVAPVTVRLVPNVEELALEPVDGTLLRRSSTALFRGLARRPRGGRLCAGLQPASQCQTVSPEPYIPIPSTCFGANCSTGILPEYRFTSSAPDIANFVAVDPAAQNARAVLLGPEEKPIPDETSGLLCAFNAGTTTVKVEAGGRSYATVVTVQKGSVQRPCGTVPLANPPTIAVPEKPVFTSFGQEATPKFTNPATTLPPPPVPVVPQLSAPTPLPTPPPAHHAPPPPPPAPALPFFPSPSPGIIPITPIVPPPPPPAVEPTPPSGTSPVTQPAFSPEPEQEEEAAFDLVHHAIAYRPAGRTSAALSAYSVQREAGARKLIYGVPVLMVIAALAAGGLVDRRRRHRPEPAFLQHRR